MRQWNGNNGIAPRAFPPSGNPSSGYRPARGPQPNEEPPNAAPAFRFDVVRSVRMHSRLALGVAAAVFLLIVGYALSRKPVYKAESLTYIEPLTTKVLTDGSPGYFDPSRYDSYIQQQIQTAERPDILRAAIGSLPDGVWRHPNESMTEAVNRLSGSLQVKRVDSSYQLSISATGDDPDGTAAVVNAVTNVYLQQGSKDEHAISDGRIQLLTEEQQRLQGELQQAQSEQASLSTSLGVANPNATTGNPYDMQLAGIRTELVGAQEAHDVAAAQLESMSAQGSAQSPAMVAAADQVIAGDPGLSSLKTTINQRRATLQSQMAGLTPSNPVYKQDQDEIASVDRDLETMTAQLRVKAQQRLEDKLRGDLQSTGNVEARLNGQLAQATAQATGAAPKLERASELAANVTRLQTSLASVDDAVRALELETHGPGLAHLSMAAAVPTAPEASKKRALLLLAFPLALLCGLAAAVLARKRDPRAYTAQDVQDTLGFPPLAILPAESEVSPAVMQEYVLRVAAGVERAYRADGARSFVFTAVSASTAMNGLVESVQRKLAELGFSAMAVDVDGVLRPQCEREVELRLDRAGGEGFAATQLERLKQEHDLLLIEAQPLLQSAESEYAICSTDATFLVVESGVTTSAELKDAAALLQRLHPRGVAVVLQGVQLDVAEPQFRAAVEQLEKNTHGVAPGVVAKAAAPVRKRTKEQREFAGDAVNEDRSEVAVAAALAWNKAKGQRLAEKKAAAAVESRETMAAAAIRQRVEQLAAVEPSPLPPSPPAAVAASSVGRDPVVAESGKEASEGESGHGDVSTLGSQLKGSSPDPVLEERDAAVPKESDMKNADENGSKKGLFERMFTRYHETPVSIIPDESEDDELASAEATEVAEAQVAMAPEPAVAAPALAPAEVDAVAAKRANTDSATSAEPEIATIVESALPVATSFAEAAEHALERALRRPLAPPVTRATMAPPAVVPAGRPTVAAAEIASSKVNVQVVAPVAPVSPAFERVSEAAVTAVAVEPVAPVVMAVEAAVVAPQTEAAIAPRAYMEPVQEAPALLGAVPVVKEPKVLVFAERAAAEERATAPDRRAAESPMLERPAAERPAVEQRVVLPAPTMRQWEFRQARTMRELAASNAEAAAKAAQDSAAAKRVVRPGLVSATGRRVLIEDAPKARQETAWTPPASYDSVAPPQSRYNAVPQSQPRLVRSPFEQQPEAESAPPGRRWGMLSRFDRRFDDGEAGSLDSRETEDERAMGTYGRGPRQD